MRTTSSKNVKRAAVVRGRKVKRVSDVAVTEPVAAKVVSASPMQLAIEAAVANEPSDMRDLIVTNQAEEVDGVIINSKPEFTDANAPSMGDNIPFLPAMDLDTFIASVEQEQEFEVKAGDAKAHRIYNALLLALNDQQRIENWSAHWDDALLPINVKNTIARAEANAFFDREFNLSPVDKMDRDEKAARDNKRAKLMQAVKFCLHLHRNGRLLGTFTFLENGTCQLLTASTIGTRACAKMGWNKSTAFMNSGDNIKLVDRPSADRGYLSWAELDALVQKPEPDATSEPDASGKSEPEVTVAGSVPKDLRQRDFSDPNKVMLEALIEARKQSESALVDASTETRNALAALERMEEMVAIYFKAPVYANALAHFNRFAIETRDILKGVPRAASGSGRPQSAPINAKVELISPPSVDALPLVEKETARVVSADELKAHRRAKAMLIKQASKPSKRKIANKRR